MAATVTIDLIEGVSWTEEGDRVTAITRHVIVNGLTKSDVADTVIKNALNTAGVPQPGDVHPVMTDLRCMSRNPNAISPTQVTIVLGYKLPGGSEADPPPGENSVLSIGGSLEQVDTQIDPNTSLQITVTHGGVTQGGTISVMVPRDEIRFTKKLQTSEPGAITRLYRGMLNQSQFQTIGDAQLWMCTQADANLIDKTTSPPTYMFSWAFMYKAEGHQPTVMFIDPETGQPPEGLVLGTGYKTIDYYNLRNFNDIGL